eukprot:CAMPEP_0183710992 /NCGR_PEP_ID=MMETSP0737-20130205/6592_1 /TAXON_ID=385413 /ORGANISM="Thalassiosira miniscula, Strain CCMP1093" /LENGTH=1164 /DNA_ID=CAMNT_0025939383 /DNA_START=60 /DNA_END=3554 /DNA_ORIENTATION=+
MSDERETMNSDLNGSIRKNSDELETQPQSKLSGNDLEVDSAAQTKTAATSTCTPLADGFVSEDALETQSKLLSSSLFAASSANSNVFLDGSHNNIDSASPAVVDNPLTRREKIDMTEDPRSIAEATHNPDAILAAGQLSLKNMARERYQQMVDEQERLLQSASKKNPQKIFQDIVSEQEKIPAVIDNPLPCRKMDMIKDARTIKEAHHDPTSKSSELETPTAKMKPAGQLASTESAQKIFQEIVSEPEKMAFDESALRVFQQIVDEQEQLLEMHIMEGGGMAYGASSLPTLFEESNNGDNSINTGSTDNSARANTNPTATKANEDAEVPNIPCPLSSTSLKNEVQYEHKGLADLGVLIQEILNSPTHKKEFDTDTLVSKDTAKTLASKDTTHESNRQMVDESEHQELTDLGVLIQEKLNSPTAKKELDTDTFVSKDTAKTLASSTFVSKDMAKTLASKDTAQESNRQMVDESPFSLKDPPEFGSLIHEKLKSPTAKKELDSEAFALAAGQLNSKDTAQERYQQMVNEQERLLQIASRKELESKALALAAGQLDSKDTAQERYQQMVDEQEQLLQIASRASGGTYMDNAVNDNTTDTSTMTPSTDAPGAYRMYPSFAAAIEDAPSSEMLTERRNLSPASDSEDRLVPSSPLNPCNPVAVIEGVVVGDETVYDAIASPKQTDNKRRRLCIVLVLVVIILMAVTIPELVTRFGKNGADGDSSVGNGTEGYLQTELPSESPSPTATPSNSRSQPTALPSNLALSKTMSPTIKAALDKYSMSYNQLGAIINGDEDGDSFGISISFSPDSNLLAIGAYQWGNDGPGYVKIYRWENSTNSFTKFVNKLEGSRDGDRFGISLSFSPDSDLLAVGAIQGGRYGPGYVNVYEMEGSSDTFTQFGNTLEGGRDDDDRIDGDRFGISLSFSKDSNLLAIGANQRDYGAGYAKVYRMDKATNTFTEFGNTLKGGRDGDRFGDSLSFSPVSNLLAISAHQDNNDGPGYINIYRYEEGTNAFTQFGNTLEGEKDGDSFGGSITFSPGSNLFAVGAWGNGPGYAKIYRIDKATNAFTEFGNTLRGRRDGDRFGGSITFSPDSNLLAVGAIPWGSYGAGYVKVYRFEEGTKAFIQFGNTLEGGKDGDRFGGSVTFSPDSNLLAVGANQWGEEEGYVSFYSR